MASRQNSKSRKSRKRIPVFTKRSEWAAWMNGADPEWLDTAQARELARVFDFHCPAWLIESEPWRQVNGGRFKGFRESITGLTVAQCAAYLRVHPASVRRWESGEVEVPFAAFEVLRLLYYTAAQRLSHKHWDGWFINPKTGELVSPDIGRLAVRPEEINGLPLLYQERAMLKQQVSSQAAQIAALQTENAAIRSSDTSRKVAAELEAMQERISELLGSVRTAQIFEFNQAPAELRRAAS